MFKKVFSYLWKLPLSGMGFFLGLSVGGVILSAVGLQAPELPAGAEANQVAVHFLLSSMVLAFILSFISQQLHCRWVCRWLILASLTWVIGGVGMVLESSIFMATGAVSSISSGIYTAASFLLPSLFLTLLIALLFPPGKSQEPNTAKLANFLSSRTVSDWLGRFLIILLAYPLTYFLFGLIVRPLIQDFYLQGQFELINPSWGQMIPIQLVRSLLFLLVSLPVIIFWSGSQKGLWLALGFSVFMLTAFLAVFTSYWFPWQLRLYQGLELLADSLVYAWVLIGVIKKKSPGE